MRNGGAGVHLEANCAVGAGAYVEDRVWLRAGTSVLPGTSIGPAGSQWRGKPAQPHWPDSDYDAAAPAPSSAWLAQEAVKLITALIIVPWCKLVAGLIFFAVTTAIWQSAGPLAGLLLLWISALAAQLTLTFIAFTSKWLLLGRVQPGDIYLGSWLHTRKEVVDALVGLMLWTTPLVALLGAPVRSSIYSHLVVRAFGVRVGGLVNWRASSWVIANSLTCYDLLACDGGFFGEGSWAVAFTQVGPLLRAEPILVGHGATIGAVSVLLGGARVEPKATVAAYSVAAGVVPARGTWIGTNLQTAVLTDRSARPSERMLQRVGSSEPASADEQPVAVVPAVAASSTLHTVMHSLLDICIQDAFTIVLQWTFCSTAASIVYLCGLAPRSLGLEDDILLALGLEDDLEAALALSAGGIVLSVVLPIMSAVCLLLTYRLMLPHGLTVGFLRRGFPPG